MSVLTGRTLEPERHRLANKLKTRNRPQVLVQVCPASRRLLYPN
ncbi:hypothetical protein [Methylocaldum marinum]|nr:hypothetical protein [Methylocaldum marinum]